MNQIKFSKNSRISTSSKLHNTILWTALVTPLLDCGAIDYSSLKQLAISQSEAGNGIVLLGSTGEGLALTSQEQLRIVEFVCQLSLRTFNGCRWWIQPN